MAAAAVTAAHEQLPHLGLTSAARAQLVRAYLARQYGIDDGWVRSRSHGEGATLAHLYGQQLLARRCYAGADTSTAAYEYKLPDGLYRSMYEAQVQSRVAQNGDSHYRGGTMARTDDTGQVLPDFKNKTSGGTGTKTRRGGKDVATAAKDNKTEEGAPAGAAGAEGTGGAAPKEGRKRVEKTSKDAKAARKEMEGVKAGYQAYVKAQSERAEAKAAGNATGEKKSQKVMDANRADYTAHRAAYRKYQAAPEK